VRKLALLALIAFPLAADQVPPREQPILAHLNQAIGWYRRLGAQAQVVTEPSDVIFIDHDVQLARQAVAQAFDGARGLAALGSAHSLSQDTKSALAQRAADAADAVQKTQAEVDALQRQAAAAPRRRTVLEQQLAETRSELAFAQARAQALKTLSDFTAQVGAGSAGLLGQIDELERSVPEVRAPAPASPPPAVSPATPRRTGQGVIGLAKSCSRSGARRVRSANRFHRQRSCARRAKDCARRSVPSSAPPCFYANTNPPTVPVSLGVIGIAGLNNLEGPRLPSKQNLSARPSTANPSMDTGLTTPSDLWSIYHQPPNNKGEGQQMAIFGWGTTNNTLSDLRLFEAERGLPAIPVTINYFGAETSITDSIGEVEWDLDTQASTGMAPNAMALNLYFGKAGTDTDLVAAIHGWTADKRGPLQGSASFSGCEEAPGADQAGGTGGVVFTGNPKQDLWEAALRRAVIEGRTMFASTGDTGAGCPLAAIVLNGVTLIPTPWMRYPAVSRYTVGVGGTVLYFNDATATSPASRALEYTWNYTGGGSSLYLAAGSYQNTSPPVLLARCATDPHGNPYPLPLPLCRGIPDVAAQSGDIVSNGYQITVGGKKDQAGGGTSLSSPLWLGMWTRIQAAPPARAHRWSTQSTTRPMTTPRATARTWTTSTSSTRRSRRPTQARCG